MYQATGWSGRSARAQIYPHVFPWHRGVYKLTTLPGTEEPMSEKDAGAPIAAIADTTLLSRSPTVLTAQVHDEIVMMSIERGFYFGLDDIGSDIWRRIERPCSFADLVDRLAADYDADRAIIAADVRALLDRMVAHHVVKLA
jgi:hypothetical protein